MVRLGLNILVEIMNKIIIRADGSRDIGLGHIMRCLTLADGLKHKKPDADIMFISKYEDGRGILKSRDYKVVDTEADEVLQIKRLADREALLITDFLDTDNAYISRIKGTTDIRVIAIDNNTRLKVIDADAVVNANVFDEGEIKSIGSTRYYLGPKYVILRKEFDTAHKEGKELRDKVQRILVLSGGGDFAGGNLILNSIEALEKIHEGIHINVIVGPTFPYRDELNKLLSKTTRPFDVSFAPSNLIELMKNADIAITAAGIVLYELASLGIPSIAVPQITPNTNHQEDIAENFGKCRACINLGKNPNNEQLYEATTMLMRDLSLRTQLSANGKALVDGRGLERAMTIISGFPS